MVQRLRRDSRNSGPFVENIMDVLVPDQDPRAPLYERFREHELEVSRIGDRPGAKYIFFANRVHGKQFYVV